jgi:hypothetical protein
VKTPPSQNSNFSIGSAFWDQYKISLYTVLKLENDTSYILIQLDNIDQPGLAWPGLAWPG